MFYGKLLLLLTITVLVSVMWPTLTLTSCLIGAGVALLMGPETRDE